MIDTKTKKIIDLLDSRKEEDVSCLLKSFPEIELISRDGSPVYAKAISTALPNAVQITDRFHLLRNLTDRAIDEIQKRMPRVVKISESPNEAKNQERTIEEDYDMGLSTMAYQNKINLMERIQYRYQQCLNYSKVAREFNIDLRTVQKYVQGRWKPSTEREHHHPLTPFRVVIETAMKAGMKQTKLFEILQHEYGYLGAYSSLKDYIQKRKRKGHYESVIFIRRSTVTKLLFDRGITDLSLSDSERITLISYLKEHRDVQKILDIVTSFRIVIGAMSKASLDQWLLNPSLDKFTELSKFRNSIYRDYNAVLMGITRPENNGIAEGKVNKIKTIKRTMYGRCSFDLLRKKVLAIEYST